MTHFYDNFLKALGERYPRKSDLVNALMDVLHLEKESIYRRLRRDVFFTSEETMQIAAAWSISLDNIICINPNKTRPFRLSMIEYINPQEADFKILERFNNDLEIVGRDPNSKMVEVLNSLPKSLYSRSEPLTRFVTMKWLYKYGIPGEPLSFGDIKIPERMRVLDLEFIERVHGISEVHFIHDEYFIGHFIDDISYFRSVKMLTDEDAALLKSELSILVDYMEDAVTKGYFPETKNKLLFYLSHTWLETEYVLCKSKDLTLSFVEVLERNAISSSDKKVFDRFMNMVQSIKRSSVLISESNALQQTEFFARQRERIMTL